METALIVRGRISNARHIELDEAVPGVDGEVEVALRRVSASEQPGTVDVLELIAACAPGTRSKAAIDRQVAEERVLP